jgi:hypothetical protein
MCCQGVPRLPPIFILVCQLLDGYAAGTAVPRRYPWEVSLLRLAGLTPRRLWSGGWVGLGGDQVPQPYAEGRKGVHPPPLFQRHVQTRVHRG